MKKRGVWLSQKKLEKLTDYMIGLSNEMTDPILAYEEFTKIMNGEDDD